MTLLTIIVGRTAIIAKSVKTTSSPFLFTISMISDNFSKLFIESIYLLSRLTSIEYVARSIYFLIVANYLFEILIIYLFGSRAIHCLY